MFSDRERRAMLELVRASVTARVSGRPAPEPPPTPLFTSKAGAFVTLRRDGDLRGCIGAIEATRALGSVIVECAAASAVEDPRFPPVTPAELDRLEYEISVLGPLEPIDPLDPAQVEVGRHGLVVTQGLRRGLLLPQVAVEWGWDRETFLSQACLKAGLPPDAWKSGAAVYRFQAEVFGEAGPTRD